MIRQPAPTEARLPRAERPRRPGPASGRLAGLLVLFALAAGAPAVDAQPGGVLKDVAFDQKLDAQVPLLLPFRDGEGREVKLADYFGERPVMLVMGYKSCPLLCSQVLSELTRSLRPLEFSVGKDFDILTVSIDPKEKPEVADSQRRVYLKRYDRPGAEKGWHALVGAQSSITALADSIGFKYQYSERTGKYAHAAGFALLTPQGKVSRYFYGIEYPARELKYALITASESKIGSPIDQVVMFCYDYDPATGRYTFAIMNAIRILGVATALALGGYLVAMLRRDRRLARATGPGLTDLPPGPATL